MMTKRRHEMIGIQSHEMRASLSPVATRVATGTAIRTVRRREPKPGSDRVGLS